MEKVQLNRKFNATVFLSPLSREIGHEIGMKMAPNFIIPSGVNLSNTHPNLKKEKFVLFVGRLSKQKGLDFIFEYTIILNLSYNISSCYVIKIVRKTRNLFKILFFIFDLG